LVLGKATPGFGSVAVRLAMSPRSVLDAHFDPLRLARIGLPEFRAAAGERRRETLPGYALHVLSKLAHSFCF
jgi:hypothetical protein